MKKFITHLFTLLLLFCSLTTVVGCDDIIDDWYEWNEWSTHSLVGRWRITDSTTGDYMPGDIWELTMQGRFYAYGANDFSESGYWDTTNHRLLIAFDGHGAECNATDLSCYVKRYGPDYMEVDVSDNIYGTRYSLRLVRTR